MRVKSFLYSIIILNFLSCNNKENKVPRIEIVSTSSTENCTDAFKKFRDNVYQKRKNKVQNYFSFPVRDENIWYAVLDNDSITEQSLKRDFTRNDFSKYYDKLFPIEFSQSLLKIKSHELFDKKIYTTTPILKKEDDWETQIYLVAEYHKNGELTFTLNYEYYQDDVKTESTVIYHFSVDKDCNIRFKNLMLAG